MSPEKKDRLLYEIADTIYQFIWKLPKTILEIPYVVVFGHDFGKGPEKKKPTSRLAAFWEGAWTTLKYVYLLFIYIVLFELAEAFAGVSSDHMILLSLIYQS